MTEEKKLPIEKEAAKRRQRNLRLFLALVLFVIALWGMTFFFRINYIKGIAE